MTTIRRTVASLVQLTATAVSVAACAPGESGESLLDSAAGQLTPSFQATGATTPTLPAAEATSQAIDRELERINDAIRASDANWVAGRNHLLELPEEKRRVLLGAVPPRDGGAVRPSQPRAPATIPDRVDYRPHDPGIRDQGQCGSCWSFATIGTLEVYLRWRNARLDGDLDLSEQRLVACVGSGCGGYQVDRALARVASEGAFAEACNPYRASDDEGLCRLGCPEPLARLRSWGDAVAPRTVCEETADARPESFNLALAAALAERGPLAVVMSVPQEFFAYESGVYRTVIGTYAGCHAVVLVGYDRPERYWILKNSWSSDWGEDGYARVSWDDAHAHLGALAYWVDATTGGDAPTPRATATVAPTLIPVEESSATPLPTDPPTPTARPTRPPDPTATAQPTATNRPDPYPRPYPPPYPGPTDGAPADPTAVPPAEPTIGTFPTPGLDDHAVANRSPGGR